MKVLAIVAVLLTVVIGVVVLESKYYNNQCESINGHIIYDIFGLHKSCVAGK